MRSNTPLRAVPAWIWLSPDRRRLRRCSAAALNRQLPGPFIFVDELIYSDLVKSFAEGGHFLVRDVSTSGYGVVYPVLISPAYGCSTSCPMAYAAVKTINSLVMSLAAVPAYLLARRMLAGMPALAGRALLTVAVPSMVYTGTVMTENVFYGLFLLVTLALVAMLERPTRRAAGDLLALVVVAYLTRAQSLAFVPAVARGAASCSALFQGRTARCGGCGASRPLYAIVGGRRQRSSSCPGRCAAARCGGLLGAYAIVSDQTLQRRPGRRLHALACGRPRPLHRASSHSSQRCCSSLGLAGRARPCRRSWPRSIPLASRSRWWSQRSRPVRIRSHPRAEPLPAGAASLIGLLVWVRPPRRRAARNWPLAIAAVARRCGAPLTIPYGRFIGEPVRADTLALLPLWTINRHFLGRVGAY